MFRYNSFSVTYSLVERKEARIHCRDLLLFNFSPTVDERIKPFLLAKSFRPGVRVFNSDAFLTSFVSFLLQCSTHDLIWDLSRLFFDFVRQTPLKKSAPSASAFSKILVAVLYILSIDKVLLANVFVDSMRAKSSVS